MRFHIKSILANLILIFILLRFINFNSHVTFLGDQGRDAIIMKRILTLEHLPAIGAPTSIGMVYLGPFYYYFMAPWLLLFNFNPLGPAFGVACLSVFFGLAAFWLVRKHFDDLSGLFFLFFLTFSGSNISLSRFSWNPNLLPIFTFFTLYAFYQVLYLKPKTKSTLTKMLWPIFFGALFSFSFQLHYLAVLLLPTFLLFFLQRAYQTKHVKPLITKIALSILSFIFFSIPLLIFDLRHQFLNSKNLLKLFTQTDTISKSNYWQRFLDTAVGFWQHTWQINLTPFWAVFLLILLFFILIKFGGKDKSPWYQFNLTHLIFFLFGFAALNSGRFEHYFGPIYLSLFLTLSFVFSYRFKHCPICRVIVPIFLLIYFLTNLVKFKVYFSPGSNQIQQAQIVSRSILNQVAKTPYQLVSIPFTETHGQFRYFLEIYGKRPLEENSSETGRELFVLCFQKECNVLNDPQWQIAAFTNKKVAKIWTVNNIKIYKLVHQQQ